MFELIGTPYKVCKVDNCGIRVKIKVNGFARPQAVFHLLAKKCPHVEVYKISLGRLIEIKSPEHEAIVQDFDGVDWSIVNEFFISWYGSIIRIGLVGNQNVLEFSQERNILKVIGFIKFMTIAEDSSSQICLSDWIFESPPEIPYLTRSVKIKNSKLYWKSLDGDKLPANAIIGGFQNEPIYIARAKHRGSLCPGKYIHSQRCAYVPWGYSEHRKDKFQILCGLNIRWVNCEGKNIPENAFIGGYSEVNNEPLYIGRAQYGSDLICGKVHVLYGTCYIPHNGCEVEYQSYEILVIPDIPQRSIQESQQCCVDC
ncbi:PREDICTED: uncharacterized protein LOC106124070 [Papilio xuthus]|uniref:Uncharacterized protein LOC106124070 n=1 Tax=Papilio xuthus TaxID=66420 RepID=A0AAJ7EG11_PAPXU|nr:PREDICTED: uncharacterized protein LOC106124070 [Papilio xuthus]